MINDLFDLVALDVPQSKTRELNFFDVSGQSTRETTICKVYAYFLDQERSPQVSNLLKNSLLNLIASAYQARTNDEQSIEPKEIEMDQFRVELEVATTSKSRVDIVLDNHDAQSAVIIEVKIFHTLEKNPLKEYWDRYAYPSERKAGVVLSLERMNPREILHEHFVNITHDEWLSAAFANGIPRELPLKDLIYLKDFINNMSALTTSNDITPELRFYLKHAEKIEKAIQTKKMAFEFVIQQLNKAAFSSGLYLHGSNEAWRHISDENRNEAIYFTVLPNEIIKSSGEISVILELGREAVKRKRELDSLQDKFAGYEQISKRSHGDSNYMHILSSTFHLAPDSFGELALRVSEVLNGPLRQARNEMLGHLKQSRVNGIAEE